MTCAALVDGVMQNLFISPSLSSSYGMWLGKDMSQLEILEKTSWGMASKIMFDFVVLDVIRRNLNWISARKNQAMVSSVENGGNFM